MATAKNDLDVDQLRAVLSSTYGAVENVAEKFRNGAEAIVNQHGARLSHESIPALMKKVARAVDVASQQLVHEQVAAAHAGQMANNYREIAQELELIARLLGQVLAAGDEDVE